MKHVALLFLILAVAGRTNVYAEVETNLVVVVDGVSYSNVTFGSMTPQSVSIRHSTGIATIPLRKLPPELQARLGYDPEKAAARSVEQEKQRLARIERSWADAAAQKKPPPYREIDGKIYDFSVVIEWANHEQDYSSAQQTSQVWSEYNARANPQGLATPGGGSNYSEAERKGAAIYLAGKEKWQGYVFGGVVYQVLPEGVLIGSDWNGQVLGLLKHHPNQSSLVDNARVSVLAMPAGNFSYTTTAGTKATIKMYDFGTKPTWKEGQQVVPLPAISQ